MALGEAALSQWVVMPTRGCMFTSREQLRSLGQKHLDQAQPHWPHPRAQLPPSSRASGRPAPDLSSMEVLQTKMWTAMPWRPLGSPAPHKVCSPCGQTPSSIRSERQASGRGSPPPASSHPLAGAHPHFPQRHLPCPIWLWPNTLLAFL